MSIPFITNDINTFQMGNSIMKNSYKSEFGKSFEEILETKVQEATKKEEEKASETVTEDSGIKNKKAKLNEGLPDIAKLIQKNDKNDRHGIQDTYTLLEKFKSEKKSKQDDPFSNHKQKAQNNIYNAVGNPLVQPYGQQGQRRMNRSQILSMWERMTPSVTEDPMKKAVRIDIPMLNDVQALVLRMHPDRSISASLLGSEIMQELIRNNKDKLDRNLRHHHLSLKEFNTYVHETDFTSESGTRKKKSNKKAKKPVVDLI